MHTTEFRCELENFKREIENRGYTEKEDFIKLLNYYYDLSVLDFCYLKETYKNKNSRKDYTKNGLYKNNSHKVIEQLYSVEDEEVLSDGRILKSFGNSRGRNLYESQEILRGVTDILKIDNEKFFANNNLGDLFIYLDMISFTGTAIVGNLFRDFVTNNVAIAYDLFNNNEVDKKEVNIVKHLDIPERFNYKHLRYNNKKEVIFEFGPVKYSYTGNNELNKIDNIVYDMYISNTDKYEENLVNKTIKKVMN